MSFLAEGLEGRSPNPVALLLDALCRPDADLGVDNPSLLEWKFEKEHAIDHVVLGKGKAGGAWQVKYILLTYMYIILMVLRGKLNKKFSNVVNCAERKKTGDIKRKFTSVLLMKKKNEGACILYPCKMKI